MEGFLRLLWTCIRRDEDHQFVGNVGYISSLTDWSFFRARKLTYLLGSRYERGVQKPASHRDLKRTLLFFPLTRWSGMNLDRMLSHWSFPLIQSSGPFNGPGIVLLLGVMGVLDYGRTTTWDVLPCINVFHHRFGFPFGPRPIGAMLLAHE